MFYGHRAKIWIIYIDKPLRYDEILEKGEKRFCYITEICASSLLQKCLRLLNTLFLKWWNSYFHFVSKAISTSCKHLNFIAFIANVHYDENSRAFCGLKISALVPLEIRTSNVASFVKFNFCKVLHIETTEIM